MNAQNSLFLSATCAVFIANAFLIIGGSTDSSGGLLDGVVGNDGLVGGLLNGGGGGGNNGGLPVVGNVLGGEGGNGLVGGLLGGGGGQNGGLLGGLLGSGSNTASKCTGTASDATGSLTNLAGQQTTCSMSTVDIIVDAVVKGCTDTSMSCDDCMKKVCDSKCRLSCDQSLLQISVSITLCLNVLLKLGILQLVTGAADVNLSATVKLALKLVARINANI